MDKQTDKWTNRQMKAQLKDRYMDNWNQVK